MPHGLIWESVELEIRTSDLQTSMQCSGECRSESAQLDALLPVVWSNKEYVVR